jgi:group II intron reverse transcriptase/maturase
VNVIKTNNIQDKVRQLQRKLYQSAKRNKARKFHALYDKLYREDILQRGWNDVKANKGSAGIDEQTIEDIESYGVDKVILEIQEELKEGRYNPPPVRRVYIPKADGRKRPLGIPTVKDRIIQSAMKIVIEPIFEADFKDCSYGFRPKRNQHQALETIRKACNNKGNYVLDGDIKGYFDHISHEKLMMLVEKRISDRRLCKLIKKWLKAGVMEEGRVEASEQGSPQGGVISPLLANIYLDYLDSKWEKHYSHLGKLIRFADDFVVVCKNYKDVSDSYMVIRLIMSRLELELNLEKTRIVKLWEGKEGFEFLGFENRKVRKKRANGSEYYAMEQWISKKAKQNVQGKVKESLRKATLYQDIETMIQRLNRKIVGWRNYYGISPKRVLLKLDKYILTRLVLWYNRKRQKRKRYEFSELTAMFKDLGLKRIAFES